MQTTCRQNHLEEEKDVQIVVGLPEQFLLRSLTQSAVANYSQWIISQTLKLLPCILFQKYF